MIFHAALCLWSALPASLAAAIPVVVEDLIRVPSGWTRLRPVDPNQLIRLSIVLETSGEELFADTLSQISSPGGARYGQHLSRSETASLVRPAKDATQAVLQWLSSKNIPSGMVRDRRHIIDATMSIKAAEELLSGSYYFFQRDGRTTIGTLAYSVPSDIRQYITSIQPTTFFEPSGSSNAQSRGGNESDAQFQSSNESECDKSNTPACLRRLYKMNNDYSKPHRRSLLGVAGFNKQTAQHDQLDMFLDRFARYAIGANFTTELVDNGTNPQGNNYPSGEGNSDIQITVAMAYTVPVRFYSTGGENHDFNPDLDISDPVNEYIEPWLQFATHLLELPDEALPQVMSISYGVNEQAVPRAYARKVCQLFGLLTIRGMSIIVASGNTGPGVSCQSNDGAKTSKFLPIFPATCPYVTAVGATEGKGPERAAIFSSGGFSEYWRRPVWQAEAVTRYIKRHGDRWEKFHNQEGRAFPDVAAQGVDYPFFNHDKIESGGGTSASAPVFAAMVSVINDMRMKKGEPPLGFLNPLLYIAASHAFTDITQGRSEGCQGGSFSGAPAPVISGAGWDAVEGWDPVTGLGTPRFDRLQKLAGL